MHLLICKPVWGYWSLFNLKVFIYQSTYLPFRLFVYPSFFPLCCFVQFICLSVIYLQLSIYVSCQVVGLRTDFPVRNYPSMILPALPFGLPCFVRLVVFPCPSEYYSDASPQLMALSGRAHVPRLDLTKRCARRILAPNRYLKVFSHHPEWDWSLELSNLSSNCCIEKRQRRKKSRDSKNRWLRETKCMWKDKE